MTSHLLVKVGFLNSKLLRTFGGSKEVNFGRPLAHFKALEVSYNFPGNSLLQKTHGFFVIPKIPLRGQNCQKLTFSKMIFLHIWHLPPCLNSPNLSKSMLLSSIASIIFQITYKMQNIVKCQGTLRIKTQSIRKIDRKIYQTKHLSNSPTLNLLLVLEQN